jgi:hypothetical protein
VLGLKNEELEVQILTSPKNTIIKKNHTLKDTNANNEEESISCY